MAALHTLLVVWCTPTLVLFLSGCAVVLPPSGGPEDRIPPTVLSCNVPNGAVGMSRRVAVVLTLSEYVERSEFTRSIVVTPRAPFQLDWSGQRVTILLDSLGPATTYRLSVAPSYRDLRGNRATASFSLVFSTGNQIDSCQVTGTIVSSATASVQAPLFVLLKPKDSLERKTEYVLPASSNGAFTVDALPCDTFIVAAFADANGNTIWDATEDGAVAALPVVTQHGMLQAPVRLWIAPALPQTPVEVVTARALSNRRVEVRITRPLVRITPQDWLIQTISTQRTIPIFAAFAADPERLILITEDSLLASERYVLLPSPDATITDSLGNRLSVASPLVFEGTSTPDAVPLGLVSVIPSRDTIFQAPLRPFIELQWSDALGELPPITLYESTSAKPVPLIINRLDAARLRAIPSDSLMPGKMYTWSVILGATRSWNGNTSIDTNRLMRTIVTLDTRNGGSVRGIIQDSCCQCMQAIVVVRRTNGTPIQLVPADAERRFFIPYLPEGDYLLDAFCDTNNNGRYDGGSLQPMRYGERVTHAPVRVSVKARWEVDGVILMLQQ
ncbi:MAG: Ig-like domain-containing protein [Bacteroidota bacterium]|nr:Ig-like domain-containing protein [Candidatus Kapabacteria bacterium]MCS7302217.1 Ig-like domain-containing protein [Candidatus Kapabacteria bacterium]MCX7937527.1 Ig-like domain-containing protein [Chlorobiota bacterium]MDW8074837.1 Ig-like domain-containing protein [Bacteroidota bacterium]MDW8271476.1 Ig-like domain-containing protein [Bacteroidota bacterium]